MVVTTEPSAYVCVTNVGRIGSKVNGALEVVALAQEIPTPQLPNEGVRGSCVGTAVLMGLGDTIVSVMVLVAIEVEPELLPKV
jgi:predicted aconitase with swiveling domain